MPIGTHTEAVCTHEFKMEVVSLVVEGALTVAKFSRRLSISEQTLSEKEKGSALGDIYPHRKVGVQ